MEIFFLFFALAVVVLYFNNRVRQLEEKQYEVAMGGGSDERMRLLTNRVWTLEKEVELLRAGFKPSETVTPVAMPVKVPTPATPPPPPPPRPAQPVPPAPPVVVPVVPQAPRPVQPVAPPPPSLGDRLRSWLGEEEWETLLGGSLLNKLGALVLVIGIALFLGYSFTHMQPAGRALTALGVSFGLLGSGIWFERKSNFKVFSRGLIAAGWAALYVTAYAMYALPAAKLIQNGVLGSGLLLLVSAAMVAHSLRYRSQALTGVAFFTTFAALAVTPSTVMAVLALLPLSGALLYISLRKNWSLMAVFGALATYSTCAMRGQSGAPLIQAESLFIVYWLLFESFDLMRTQQRQTGPGLQFLFPLNAVGFLALSQVVWSSKAPDSIWVLYAGAAGLYLLSAACRFYLRPRNSFHETDDLLHRVYAGSFEAPSLLAACLSGLAIAVHVTGILQGFGFAVEAEILYLAGIYLSTPVFCGLGGLGFVISLLCLLGNPLQSGWQVNSRNFTPLSLFHAGLFYVNRLLKQPNAIFSSAAAALIAAVLAVELKQGWIGTGWIIFGFLLFEFGFRKALAEFRFQGYLLAVGGCAVTMLAHIFFAWHPPVFALWFALAGIYAVSLRIRFAATNSLFALESQWLNIVGAGVIASLASYLTWRLAPHQYEGLCITALSLVLFELGLRKLPSALAYWAFAVTLAGMFAVQSTLGLPLQKFAPLPVPLSFLCLAFCLYWLTWRGTIAGDDWLSADARLIQRGVSSTLGCFFALAASWTAIPDVWLPLVWAAYAVLLFLLGSRRSLAEMRWHSYLVALAGAFIVVAAPTLGLSRAIGVIAICYAAQFLSPLKGQGSAIDAHPRIFWSLLATFLLTFVLWHELPGGLLTVALGAEAIALLAAGFPLHERILRLQGLSVLLLCILKLFLWDLRNLETLYRILSFVALGAIMLSVSWVYTRFKESVRKLL